MNKSIFILSLACVSIMSCGDAKENEAGVENKDSVKVEHVEVPEVVTISGTYVVDSTVSEVTWRGDKSAKLDFHKGKIVIASGNVVVENDFIIGGEFTFDIGSIYNVDTDAAGKTAGLAKHLKNEDFFNQDAQGMPKFSIKNVQDGIITGDFTVREVTQEISFAANVVITENSLSAQADSVHIPMTGFGMDYYEKHMKPTIIVGFNVIANK